MFLGIEIGGTKLQLGLGQGDGVLAGLWRGVVDPSLGSEGIRRQITEAVPELLAKSGIDRSKLRAIGIGFGGPVDDATQTVIKSHQIAGWDDFPLADWIGSALGLPAVLGNDADVAGLAEALFGAGKGLSPIFYITIGSGIGGGLIVDGEIYRGIGRGAAEIGHLRIASGGRPPIILEEQTSGWAIARQPHSKLPPTHRAEDLARLAAKGDAEAQAILNRAWEPLAEAICHVIALLCPAHHRHRRWRVIDGRGGFVRAVASPGVRTIVRTLRRPHRHCPRRARRRSRGTRSVGAGPEVG